MEPRLKPMSKVTIHISETV